jgi:hypothetical protein
MEQYEGRIERRLQKAMTEFHRWRLMRQMEEQEEPTPKAENRVCKTKRVWGMVQNRVTVLTLPPVARCWGVTMIRVNLNQAGISQDRETGRVGETALVGVKMRVLDVSGGRRCSVQDKAKSGRPSPSGA